MVTQTVDGWTNSTGVVSLALARSPVDLKSSVRQGPNKTGGRREGSRASELQSIR